MKIYEVIYSYKRRSWEVVEVPERLYDQIFDDGAMYSVFNVNKDGDLLYWTFVESSHYSGAFNLGMSKIMEENPLLGQEYKWLDKRI